jgi:hypothetical protein
VQLASQSLFGRESSGGAFYVLGAETVSLVCITNPHVGPEKVWYVFPVFGRGVQLESVAQPSGSRARAPARHSHIARSPKK